MNKVLKISLSVVVALAAVVTMSCSNESDQKLISQQSAISNYLKGSHKPKLIPEEELSSSLDEQPEYYVQWGLDLYRYIATMYAEGRDSWVEIDADSSVAIRYKAYIFTNGAPSVSALYATNDEAAMLELEAAGLNVSYEWTTDPYVIQLGTTDVIEGLEQALVGCREGDSVEIYMTYEMAYGKQFIGMIPSRSSVVWYVDILEVKQ